MDLYLSDGDILRYTSTTVTRLESDGVTVVEAERAHTADEATFWADYQAELATLAALEGEPPEISDAIRRDGLRDLNTSLVVLRNAVLGRDSQAANAADLTTLAGVVGDVANDLAQTVDALRSVVKYLIRD